MYEFADEEKVRKAAEDDVQKEKQAAKKKEKERRKHEQKQKHVRGNGAQKEERFSERTGGGG